MDNARLDLLLSPMVVCHLSQTQTHTDKQMTHKGNMTCRPRLINSLSQANYCLGIATSGIWLESIKGTTTAKSDATDCQGIMDANGTDAQLPRRTYRNRCGVHEPNQLCSSQEPARIHRKHLQPMIGDHAHFLASNVWHCSFPIRM